MTNSKQRELSIGSSHFSVVTHVHLCCSITLADRRNMRTRTNSFILKAAKCKLDEMAENGHVMSVYHEELKHLGWCDLPREGWLTYVCYKYVVRTNEYVPSTYCENSSYISDPISEVALRS